MVSSDCFTPPPKPEETMKPEEPSYYRTLHERFTALLAYGLDCVHFAVARALLFVSLLVTADYRRLLAWVGIYATLNVLFLAYVFLNARGLRMAFPSLGVKIPGFDALEDFD